MPTYETLCVLHPELPETRVKEINTWIQKILEGAQGSVVQVEEWGIRDLAFHSKKQRRGYYLRIEYTAPPAAPKELERNLRLNEDVLRFLSVALQPPTTAQTPAQPPPVSPTVLEAGVGDQ